MRIFPIEALWLLLLPALASAVPKGLIAEVVTSTQAVTGIFAPNPSQNGKPMLLLIHKEGKVKVDVTEHIKNAADKFPIKFKKFERT